MKIIVAGCGKIGETILAALAKDGHDLVAMDRSSCCRIKLSTLPR